MRTVLVGIAALVAACGPSMRGVHQSTAYFERCHAADFDPSVSLEQKEQCWATWLQYYTHGQPPHRVSYATERREALSRGEEVEPLPGVSYAAVDASQRSEYLTAGGSTEPVPTVSPPEPAPSPEQADNAPPEPGPVEPEAAPRERRLPGPPGRPHGACVPICNPRWDSCVARCEDGVRQCRDACETEHRTCMAGCY
jgi:hypothetical protein